MTASGLQGKYELQDSLFLLLVNLIAPLLLCNYAYSLLLEKHVKSVLKITELFYW